MTHPLVLPCVDIWPQPSLTGTMAIADARGDDTAAAIVAASRGARFCVAELVAVERCAEPRTGSGAVMPADGACDDVARGLLRCLVAARDVRLRAVIGQGPRDDFPLRDAPLP